MQIMTRRTGECFQILVGSPKLIVGTLDALTVFKKLGIIHRNGSLCRDTPNDRFMPQCKMSGQ